MKNLPVATATIIASVGWLSLQGAAPDPRLIGFRSAPGAVLDNAPPAVKNANALDQARLALQENADTKANALKNLVDVENDGFRSFLKYALYGELYADFLGALENARTDKQTGSGPGGTGTTSLVSKASTPSIVSAAVEAGALTQTVASGAEMTFRGNVVGIGRLLLGEDQFPFCPNTGARCDSGAVTALKPLSFSLSMDANGQTSTNVPVSGSATPQAAGNPAAMPTSVNLAGKAQRVASWSVRYAILNPRALTSSANQKTFAGAMAGPADSVLANSEKTIKIVNRNDYVAWQTQAETDLGKASPDISPADFDALFAAELDKLLAIFRKSDPSLHDDMLAAWRSYDAYFATRRQALESLSGGTMLSVEYTDNAPLDQPRISNLRVIVSKPLSSKLLFTGNFAADIYNSVPAGAAVSRFRDAQIAAELDFSTGQMAGLGAPYISAAGYYQYMKDPGLISINSGSLAPGTNIQLPGTASVLLAQRGNIAIGQLKWTLPFKNTGVSFPVGVTWANRSEFVKGTNVSGHIGISYDLDSLFTSAAKQP